MANLLIGVAKTSRGFLNAYLAQNLSRFQGRRQKIDKEVICFDDTFAAFPDCHHLGIKGNDGCRPIAGGIGVGHAAADCSFISHLHVADVRSAFGQ